MAESEKVQKLVRPVLVTPENHAEYDAIGPDDRFSMQFREALDAMFSLNKHLDDRLAQFTKAPRDWGGGYATWLESFGIAHETENGWWSLAAIDPDNIDAFVEMREDAVWGHRCDLAQDILSDVARMGDFRARVDSVREIVNRLCPMMKAVNPEDVREEDFLEDEDDGVVDVRLGPREEDIVAMIPFKGNSVGYIHSKMVCYKDQVGMAFDALRDLGFDTSKGRDNNELRELLKKFVAKKCEELQDLDNEVLRLKRHSAFLERHGKNMSILCDRAMEWWERMTGGSLVGVTLDPHNPGAFLSWEAIQENDQFPITDKAIGEWDVEKALEGPE